MLHDLALPQKGLLVQPRDVIFVAASTAQELKENVASAAEITYKRHMSALEQQPRVVKRKACADATGTDEACEQQDFAANARQEIPSKFRSPSKGRGQNRLLNGCSRLRGPIKSLNSPPLLLLKSSSGSYLCSKVGHTKGH
jgi:hypothetical protein